MNTAHARQQDSLLAIPTSDIELVSEVRGQDGESDDAYAELWRRHYKAGVAAAKLITNRFDPDDLTQEAFARTLAAIQNGAGPTEAFRPYLYASIRSVSMNWGRHADSATLDEADTFVDPESMFANDALERSVTGTAFRSLRPEWRSVLWYAEVEGMKPREVSLFMGISANAVSAMLVRARDALRSAWLQAHLNSAAADPECRETVEQLGAYNRGKLSVRDRNKVQDHLTACLKCSILVDELDGASSRLGVMLLPVVLGPGVTALSGGGSAAATRLSLKTAASVVTVIVVASVTAGAALGMFADSDPTIDVAANDTHAYPDDGEVSATPEEAPEPESSEESVVAPEVPVNARPEATSEPEPDNAPVLEPVAGPARIVAEPSPSVDPPDTAAPEPSPSVEASAEPSIEPVLVVELDIPVLLAATGDGLYLPTLSGTATAGSTLILLDAGTGDELARTVVASNGEWSLLVSPPDSVTVLSVVARIENAEGESSALTAPMGPFVLAAPTVTVNALFAPDPALYVDGTLGQSVEAVIDGVPSGNLYTLLGSTLEFWFPQYANGSHAIGFRYVDTATGQIGRSETVSFVDGLVP
ncbi:sigma-70 family RNA polymerase sigma factor [Demequina aurantiaca]|uniref:sigma-70 family RNA polymerase sigma factor n=1 Tax=Demequina aurantiaca TaxID=676200 RepID=UPI003D32A902